MAEQQKIDEFIKKVNDSKQGKLDLSADQDLSIAIMNLISIEEHFFFTAERTGKSEYFDLLNTAREMRKELLKKIIKEYEGEVWCISKHLLAASMRLMEVGTKHLGQGEKQEAEDMFKKAYELYSLFWGLNLKLLNVGDIKKIDDNQLDIHDQDNNHNHNVQADYKEKPDKPEAKKGLFGKLGDVVKRAINCCIE